MRNESAVRSYLRNVERWFVAFLVVNLVMGTSSVLIPLKIDRILEEGPSRLGILATFASAAAVLGSLLWGRLSDAVRRRKTFVVLSCLMVAVTHAGLALSRSFAVLVLHNTLLSFFWVANASVAVLLVIEWKDERGWESGISLLNFFGAIGWLLGLVAGAVGVSAAFSTLAEAVGMRTLFLSLSALAFVSAVLAGWLIPSVVPRFTQRKFRGVRVAVGNLLVEVWRFNPLHLYHRASFRRLGRLRPETRGFLIASALAFTGIGFFAVPLALLLSQRMSYSPSLVFFSYVVLHSGIVLAYPIALHRIRRRGNRRVQIAALAVRAALLAVGAGVLWRVDEVPWLAAAPFLFVIGLTWSFFQLSGVAFASRLAKPENRGLTLGIYNAIAGGSSVVAGISSGYLAQNVGHEMTYLCSASLLLCAIIVLVRLPDPAPGAVGLVEDELEGGA